ncbi:MAG: divergent polysaccharide deacetylase family protein [Spirochaetales bacterium]|nr:divergent polysaccharide deacetylase family protein [Spirochaetales bacterium]
MKKKSKPAIKKTAANKRKRTGTRVNTPLLVLLLSGILVLLVLILLNIPKNNGEGNVPISVAPDRYSMQNSIDPESDSRARNNRQNDRMQDASASQTSEETSENVQHRNTALLSATSRVIIGRIAVVIDDAGNDAVSLAPFLLFKGKLTVAVLPLLPNSKLNAENAFKAKKEVILHQPMQPIGENKTGPGMIGIDASREQIQQLLRENLKTVPHASGLNNHMGSLATQNDLVMDAVFGYCKQENMYFLDSRTTAATLGKAYAEKYNISFAERKIFLDSVPGKENIADSLNKGIEHAKRDGSVVVIGHVQNPEVIAVLNEQYDRLVASGIEFVTVRELIEYNRSRIQ